MSIAFDVVFGLFVVAIVVVAFLAVRWGVRRDRVARARQAESQAGGSAAASAPGPVPVPPTATREGHRP